MTQSLQDVSQTLQAWIDSREAAAMLGQSPYQTREWLKTKKLRGVKMPGGRWRIKRADVEALLNGEVQK